MPLAYSDISLCFQIFLVIFIYFRPSRNRQSGDVERVVGTINRGMFHLGCQRYNATLNKRRYHSLGGEGKKKGFYRVCLTF